MGELTNLLNRADSKIKDLTARVHNTKKELARLQKINASLNGRDQELRGSIAKIQELAEALAADNAELKGTKESSERTREHLEHQSRELQCLLSAATSERDTAHSERKQIASKFKQLSYEKNTALRDKEDCRMKLDKMAAEFEADYETVRSKIDALLLEKKNLQRKITFLEASKASVEHNADRILQRDNALAGQHDRLKSSYKEQSTRMAQLQDEVGQLVQRLARLKEENGRLSCDNCALKDMVKTANGVEEPNGKTRAAAFGFRRAHGNRHLHD